MNPDDTTYPRLVADIGGTNARFAWLAAPGGEPAHGRTLPVAEHAGPAEAARHYLDGLAETLGTGWQPPRRAALAVATAITGDEVALTNSHWRFSRRGLQQALGLQALAVLNDFEALALALPHLGDAQLRRHPRPVWGAPAQAPVGTVLAVVGPGTGLGVGAVVRSAAGWMALPGEGGHVTLAATTALEAAVIAVVQREYPHVSAERLLSGSGLPLLQSALATVQGRELPADGGIDAARIVHAAEEQGDALAIDTLSLFCALLGSFAGNVVLTLGARGGLYIGGGVLPRLAGRFFASEFRSRFEAKGRLAGYLAAVPSALITDTHAALLGAAHAFDNGG
ncbi:glucokinase [Pseudorhodoferax sp.]|uniref:glucokinase n=1 Tax=Pseudorhodoferax sp. TaxID=1993553 RepID=UPI002DD698DC|nr:glucokinase [Pseudorhodoferax sp.]